MLGVGSKIIYKHGGVYEVEAVETPSFAANSNVLYYKLTHIFSNSKETVYVPCDSENAIRSVITEEEYSACLDKVKKKEITAFTAKQPQIVAEHYKRILSDNTFESLLSVYRELLTRENDCESSGKKLRQAEAHYLTMTEKALCEELCICMSSDLEQAREKLRACLN